VNPAFARLRLVTGDQDDLLSLHAWLTDEDALRGRVIVEREQHRPDQMGAIADVLVVALGAGGAVTVLARSVPAWLRRHADVTVEVSDNTGRTVKITATGPVDAQAVIQAALDAGP
jgi:membrane-associated two-gene conflict system component 1 (EACC1)